MDLENELLEIIERDSRRTLPELATMLSTTEETVAKTLRKLESDHVILGYHTILDREKLGEQRVTALIQVGITPQREVGFDNVAEKIYRFPEVRSVYLLSGGCDLLVTIEGDSLKSVADFVARRLSTIDGVTSTQSSFILKTYKKDGLILDDQEYDQRMVVAP